MCYYLFVYIYIYTTIYRWNWDKNMSSSLTYEVHRYGKDHELQRVGVWRSPDAKPQSSNPWIM